jgi:hypothetical protein
MKSISVMKNDVFCTVRIGIYFDFRLISSLMGTKRDTDVATGFALALW